MSPVHLVWIIGGTLLFVIAMLGVITTHSSLARMAIVILTAFFLLGGYVAPLYVLGNPKPIEFEWLKSLDDVTILAFKPGKNEVRLWIETKDGIFYYLLSPFSEKQQEQLEDAAKDARKSKTKLKGKMKPHKGGREGNGPQDDEEMLFYPEPVAPDPDKPYND